MEPLGAPEDVDDAKPEIDGLATANRPASKTGIAIKMEQVSVQAAGQLILSDIDLTIEPGSHVAVVGASGAGKSSLVGLLLGWHRPAAGQVIVDGKVLQGADLEQLRRETAWVDPAVQLWNRPLIDNLQYGNDDSVNSSFGQVIEQADLRSVLEGMADGLQTSLGEGGGLVSGGEGQRVRFGRALARSEVRLVILDEPFRGLDRDSRRTLLARARRLWSKATLLCITHDVTETQDFDRVIVVEDGRIIENDEPALLSQNSDSRYRALLEAEAAVREKLWSGEAWRRLQLTNGRLISNDSGRKDDDSGHTDLVNFRFEYSNADSGPTNWIGGTGRNGSTTIPSTGWTG